MRSVTENEQTMTRAEAGPATAEIQSLRAALDQADRPLTVPQIAARLNGAHAVSRRELASQLDALVDQGTLYRFGAARSPRYWTRDLAEFARSMVVDVLSKRPRTRTELAKALEVPLAQLSREKRQKVVADLLKGGEIRELPLLLGTRANRLSVAPPDPREYLEQALVEIRRRLALAGVVDRQIAHALQELAEEHMPPRIDRANVRGMATQNEETARPADRGATLTDDQIGELILSALPQVEPSAAQGALVTVRDVRRVPQLVGIAKGVFDQAVLALSERGTLALHRHDYPGSLTPAERDDLVSDDAGSFFIGMTLRR